MSPLIALVHCFVGPCTTGGGDTLWRSRRHAAKGGTAQGGRELLGTTGQPLIFSRLPLGTCYWAMGPPPTRTYPMGQLISTHLK